MSTLNEILDELAAAAYEAVRVDELSPAQVNKMLEVYESTRDVNLLLAFMARQAARRAWGRGTSARRLYGVLRGMVGSAKVEDVRRVLGIFKWLFEAGKGRGLPRMDPGQPARKGFFSEYLEACLK